MNIDYYIYWFVFVLYSCYGMRKFDFSVSLNFIHGNNEKWVLYHPTNHLYWKFKHIYLCFKRKVRIFILLLIEKTVFQCHYGSRREWIVCYILSHSNKWMKTLIYSCILCYICWTENKFRLLYIPNANTIIIFCVCWFELFSMIECHVIFVSWKHNLSIYLIMILHVYIQYDTISSLYHIISTL